MSIIKKEFKLFFKCFLIFIFWLNLSGCSFFVSSATDDFGNNLTTAILSHNDPDTVLAGIPTYLLLLDSLILDDPDNETLLASASTLYSSYVTLLNTESQRNKLLTSRAFDYGMRFACEHRNDFCNMNALKYDAFEKIIAATSLDDIAALHVAGSAWASWIQTNRNDWNAVAQLAHVKLIMKRILELDKNYKQGDANIYLGVINSLIPPSLGGTPDVGRQHFEQAILLSENQNLMAKVLYARYYARLVFDRELHDRLLNEVLAAETDQPNLTLINTIARKQAKILLEQADDYF